MSISPRSEFRNRPFHPELAGFLLLLALLNWPLWAGQIRDGLIFLPEAVKAGQWWRLVTHPLVHVTWYHLLLDGCAFALLYHTLAEPRFWARLFYVVASGAGALVASVVTGGILPGQGLCGLSGIAHGLTAVTALEILARPGADRSSRRLGWTTLTLAAAKAAYEAVTGQAFLAWLHFGLMGAPVAISHAGGVLGGVLAWALARFAAGGSRKRSNCPTRQSSCREGFDRLQGFSHFLRPGRAINGVERGRAASEFKLVLPWKRGPVSR